MNCIRSDCKWFDKSMEMNCSKGEDVEPADYCLNTVLMSHYEPRNLPEANVNPQLCDVLAELEDEFNGNGGLMKEACETVLSKYFA